MKYKCYRCRFQPLLLVYTNAAGIPVDAKHAPKSVNIISKEKLLETPEQSPTHRKVKKRKSKGHRSRSNSPAVLNKTNELNSSPTSISSRSPSSSGKTKNRKRTSVYDSSKEKSKLKENGSVNSTCNGLNQLPSTAAPFLNETTGQIQDAVLGESYSDSAITNKNDSGNSNLSNNQFDNIGNPWKIAGSKKSKSLHSKRKNKYLKSKSGNNDSLEQSCSSINHTDFVSSLDNLTVNDRKNIGAQGQNESEITNGISSINEINGNPQKETYRGNYQQSYSKNASLQEELHPKHSEINDILLRDIKLNPVDQNDKIFNTETIKKNHDQNLMEFELVCHNGKDTNLIHFNGRPEVFYETQKQGI